MALEVQKWLENSRGNYTLLKEQLGITSTFHEDGRVILNYDQIESPKTNEIVRECRGLVLDSKTYELISRSFYRFFNWKENINEMRKFQWESCIGYHKHDGSLLNVYNWRNNWYINTRGSFGEGLINDQPITWHDLAYKAIGSRFFENADPELSYAFELCSLYNKIVRTYNTPCSYLLSTFNGETELTHDISEGIAKEHRLLYPEANIFDDIADVEVYLGRMANEDKTFEGIVIRDQNNIRFKVKSQEYLILHRLKNNNYVKIPDIIKLVLANELDEFLTYFSEYTELCDDIKNYISSTKYDLVRTYKQVKDIHSQKEFALSIQNHPYKSIMFHARKNNLRIDRALNGFIDLIDKNYKRKI